MSAFPVSFAVARVLSVSTLLGAAALVGGQVFADPGAAGSGRMTPFPMLVKSVTVKPATEVPGDKGESVEQRIINLHAALKITPGQAALWGAVAQAMRENATALERLVIARQKRPSRDMTALDDLDSFQAFAQAQVDALKNLTPPFVALYDSMSAEQRLDADQAYQNLGHRTVIAHG